MNILLILFTQFQHAAADTTSFSPTSSTSPLLAYFSVKLWYYYIFSVTLTYESFTMCNIITTSNQMSNSLMISKTQFMLNLLQVSQKHFPVDLCTWRFKWGPHITWSIFFLGFFSSVRVPFTLIFYMSFNCLRNSDICLVEFLPFDVLWIASISCHLTYLPSPIFPIFPPIFLPNWQVVLQDHQIQLDPGFFFFL